MNETRKVAPTERELELKKRKREQRKWNMVGILSVFAFMANQAIWVETGESFAARVLSADRVAQSSGTDRYILELLGTADGERMAYERVDADLVIGDMVNCKRFQSPIMIRATDGKPFIGSDKYDCKRATGR